MSNLKLRLLFSAVIIGFSVNAQKQKTIHYQAKEVALSDITLIGNPQISAKDYRLYEIDTEVLKAQLAGIASREDETSGFKAMISFPHPDGTMHEYQATSNSTLSDGLSTKFPEINTYDAVDFKGSKVKWDITPKGLHVMIFQPNGKTIFIDPLVDGDKEHYIVYYKADFYTDKLMSCDFQSVMGDINLQEKPVIATNKTFGTCELRTYRLALAATGEYTAFHGGTVAGAQAAQATTMNRVNGIYERDMAITMSIIGNNDLIIYTNSGSDPYFNGNPGTMINQNQTNCNNEIGSANYDIGHVFGTNSGGLAGLGVVCSGSKAKGVTGSSAPIGDPFDVDYVAHEMGHQFGANHTQNNSCNSVSATRMEPGSASTIMGYAGICSPNVQSNSDDHFHGISLEEIGDEILSGGHTCEFLTPLGNGAPSITGTNGNVSLPIGTPFSLTATVTDPDGDLVSYCWEQMDNQASTQPPVSTSTGGPNFRSNSPTQSPTRYFPNLAAVIAGVTPTWEVVPTVSRTMNFRVTVRDQGLNVPGCNDHEDVTVTFDGASGPFIVLYPSVTGIVWSASTTETVTWDVANTDNAPVSCATVDILLSTDGGLTYPTTLVSGVNNDGSQDVTVPGIATTTARVMVVNSNGTFFDISDNDFEIDVPACTNPDLASVTGTTELCNGSSTTLSIGSGNLNDATDWQWYETSCGGNAVGSGTSILVSPTASTSYFVRGEGGCVVAAGCTEVTVEVNPVYNSNETASICEGETYTFPDATTATTSQVYTSTLSSVDGCDSVIVTDLVITDVNVLVSLVSGGLQADLAGATYQWVDCNNSNAPIAGATNQSYTPASASGSYAVIVTSAGCSDTSSCTDIDQTSVDEFGKYNISVYPNPATNFVSIEWLGEVQEIELTDARGRLLYSFGNQSKSGLKVDLNSFAKGVYFIHLFTEDGRIVKDFIKQ